ncbi:MAG: hypothetical protein KDB80_16150 [Planctomycetes bacterium]|nr:hypothetical protein [Planctomycetota bacterium]
MTKFLLLLRSSIEKDYSQLTPDDMQRIIQGYEKWAGSLAAENRLLAGQKLTDEGGCVLQPGAGSVSKKDGPYIETKEVVGGYYVIEADDQEHAVRLCEGHPNFEFGSIEIRQIDFMGGPEELA